MGPPTKRVLGEAAHTLGPTHKRPTRPHAWRHLDQPTRTEERERRGTNWDAGQSNWGGATWVQWHQEGEMEEEKGNKNKTHLMHTQCHHSSPSTQLTT